ncbi:hypothetical protein [Ferruginibacter profundus]
MIMPGRKFTQGSSYRYGFNGQEKSEEIGEGFTTAEFWEYDARLARRWNVDPKQKAWESPYACFSNNPIINIDIHGDSDSTVTTPNGGTMILPNGAKIIGINNTNQGIIEGVYNKDGKPALINVAQGSVFRFELNGNVYNSLYDLESATFVGYGKNGSLAPSLTAASSEIVETHTEWTKPSTEESGKVFKAGMTYTLSNSEIPGVAQAGTITTATVTGVAFLASSLLIVTTVQDLKITSPAVSIGGYFLDMASQRGKNRGKLDPQELAQIAKKVAAGTATALELQKWKRHQKNTKERPSRQSKD